MFVASERPNGDYSDLPKGTIVLKGGGDIGTVQSPPSAASSQQQQQGKESHGELISSAYIVQAIVLMPCGSESFFIVPRYRIDQLYPAILRITNNLISTCKR